MKKIEALVKMAALERVTEALVRTGVTGITLSHVRGSRVTSNGYATPRGLLHAHY